MLARRLLLSIAMWSGLIGCAGSEPGQSQQPSVPEASVPEASVPEASVPEASAPEASVPEASVPEASVPEAGMPEASMPEASMPEASMPEASMPEASMPEPSMPQPCTPGSQRVWSQPELIENTELAYTVQAAMNARGDALVAWDQRDGKVQARVFDGMGQTWTASASLDRDDNPDHASVPSVAIDVNGRAVVAWHRESDVEDRMSVWTNRFDPATRAWGVAEQIQGGTMGGVPQVAVDAAGNAVLVFAMLGSLTAVISTARAAAATGTWTAAEALAQPPTLHSLIPLIAVGPEGDAVVTWTARSLTTSQVWGARYSASTRTWTEARAIGKELEVAQATGVAINAAGVAFAIWVQGTGDDIQVWSSRSAASGGEWSAPVRVDHPGTGAALLPEVAVDAAGNAIALWSADDFTRENVWANRFDAASGAWQTAMPVENEDADAAVARLDMDGKGNALAIWTRDDTRKVPWVSWYDAASNAWGPGAPLDPAGMVDSKFGQVAVAPDGRAIAVWYRNKEGVYASHCR